MLLAPFGGVQVEQFQAKRPAEKIVVAGAGLAGLSAAYELGRLGHEVLVVEAQSRLAGRVRTLRDSFAHGVSAEAGAARIPNTHDLTLHYARQFGLTLEPAFPPGLHTAYHVRGRRVVLDGSPEKWPLDLTADERSMGLAGLRRRYIEATLGKVRGRGFAQDEVGAFRDWDRPTVGEWLRTEGASPAAIELMTLGMGPEIGSAAWYLMYSMNLAGVTESFHIRGGNDQLPRALAARVNIRYGSVAVAIEQNDRGVRVITRRGSGMETIEAARAVCALPCPVIGKILDGARLSRAKAAAIRNQRYSHSAKVFLQTRTRFWQAQGLNGSVSTDLPIERLMAGTGETDAGRGTLAVFLIGAYAVELERMDEGQRVKVALDQARRIFPEIGREFEGGVSKCWGIDPWQHGAFAIHGPGEIGNVSVLARPEGRIHFAGEHTSRWTGWMQGAFESARRVVREING